MTPEKARGPQILLVDDNPTNLQVLYQTLGGHGYRLLAARSGKDAIAIAERALPDLILLDVMMPEMDGIQVLDRIRTNPQFASLPVILVTAKGQDEDVLAGYKTGADYYITKPFTARQLLHGIGLVLGNELTD